MKIIIERPLTNEEWNKLQAQGIDTTYTVKDALTIKDFYRGESVGFYLDALLKPNIELINDLLFRKHPVTIKYLDKVYKLNTLDEWTYSYQSDTDQIKTKRFNHEVLIAYYENRKKYFESKKIKKTKEQLQALTLLDAPTETEFEIEMFLSTFGRLYDIHIDWNDEVSKLTAYQQLKWYIENNIDYANEVKCITPEETPYFTADMFQEDEEMLEQISAYPLGDDEYLADTAYKKSIGHIFTKDEIIKIQQGGI